MKIYYLKKTAWIIALAIICVFGVSGCLLAIRDDSKLLFGGVVMLCACALCVGFEGLNSVKKGGLK